MNEHTTPEQTFSRPPGEPFTQILEPDFPGNWTQEQKICGMFKILLDILNTGIYKLTGSTSIDISSLEQSKIDYINQYFAMYGMKMIIENNIREDWYYFHDACDCFLRNSMSRLMHGNEPVIIRNNMPFWNSMIDSTGMYRYKQAFIDDFSQIIYADTETLNQAFIIKFTILQTPVN